jgi:NTP pyrophosphatase (non-canonical NTP hydrolase)
MHMTKDKIQYLTAKLQEEAAEVIQAVSKINRFGPQNSHPDRTTTNLEELVGELEDFLAIVAALEHYQYIDLTLSRSNIANKAKALLQG